MTPKQLLPLLWATSMLGGCLARVVTVSPGPLIRVEGQPVSIRCDVNDYMGPREQDFEWVMSREANGQQMKIISTFDASYSHTSLSKRVASGDISVLRLRDNAVELKIAEAETQDAGFYWCQTPSTDSVIGGNYEAQVQLIVIANTLKVSPQTPPAVVPEGSDVTLSCNVTRELTQPTYLSVTWSLKKEGVSEEILTFGPQGDVLTGAKYARRYADGAIRLAPGKGGLFELVISRVTTSDEGIYECNGTEWTHQNGGKWIPIVGSVKEMGTVAVTPTGQSLSVKASSSSSSSSAPSANPHLAPGDKLTLLCAVAADNLPSLSLEVSWLADGRDLVTMERGGVVISNMSAGSGRVNRREASMERTGADEYRLAVRRVSTEDGGEYACRVRAFIEKGGKSSGGGGRWHMAAEKTSNAVTVKVSQIKPSFTLDIETIAHPEMTSEPTELACRVTNITQLPVGGRLGVTWEHIALPGATSEPQATHSIGSMDGYGNLVPGAVYSDRLASGTMSLTRVQPDTFKLRFLRTQEIDMGQYVCAVSAWSVDSRGDVAKTAERRSSPLTLRWEAKRPSLNIVAKRIREASVGGATFEMSCTAVTQNLGQAGFSVLIQSQDSLESNVRTIMTLSPDSIMQHGGATDPNRRDSLVLTKSGPAAFRFRLGGVQLSDRGFYWCDITAWTKQQPGQTWTRAMSAESNKVKIDFQENGPSFSIAIHSDTSTVYPWQTAKMKCSLRVSGASPMTDHLAYELRWFFTRLRGGQTTTQVAGVDRFGVVGKEFRNSSSEVSVQREDTHAYTLSVHGAHDSDSGEYHCVATPWYLSASTGAWTQAGELTSPRIFLTVRFAVWESLKLPLLYGVSASIGVGLFSLVLGLVCAQCCCRNAGHTPRSRNKLMDLEID
ncbi:prostaglandin F2 receptor negative regulator-like isoform X2 [Phyllopteryx taeniolatus]|uniref:prostaglandin F2 receptor negative regulator-like isoform X2 n=1 Tax=Phyllopteryx taeniolatus TaxID=161469 RepID=UPI002AD42351|nr:prostaglandin F2 receptor negative regulator-like isoform X2 [Phyllopteryx taeniolatus]